jgi:hypothetical protein
LYGSWEDRAPWDEDDEDAIVEDDALEDTIPGMLDLKVIILVMHLAQVNTISWVVDRITTTTDSGSLE